MTIQTIAEVTAEPDIQLQRKKIDPELDALEDELLTLAANINAATYRWLVLLAEFDRRGGWAVDGVMCCAQWLSWASLDRVSSGHSQRGERLARDGTAGVDNEVIM